MYRLTDSGLSRKGKKCSSKNGQRDNQWRKRERNKKDRLKECLLAQKEESGTRQKKSYPFLVSNCDQGAKDTGKTRLEKLY